MKMLFVLFFSMLIYACNPQNSDPKLGGDPVDSTWLIPKDEVFDGGPGKDGIPSVDTPKFIPSSQVDFLDDNSMVIAITFGSDIKVYPHAILNWHEIVNDKLEGKSFALTYCPLTGTAINWNSKINGTETTFGVSGLLYNSNLIPYDRKTGSNWSQMRLDCVNGELQGSSAATYPVLETTWGTIKNLPNLSVMTTETGFQRNYSGYPYGDYLTNDDNIIFPVSNADDRRGAKDRVLGILESGLVKTYSFESFDDGSTKLVTDEMDGRELLIVGSKTNNYLVAFYAENGTEYEVVESDFPNILKDSEGNIYDVFGRALSGPKSGERLEQPIAFMGFWFAWAAFYPDLDLY